MEGKGLREVFGSSAGQFRKRDGKGEGSGKDWTGDGSEVSVQNDKDHGCGESVEVWRLLRSNKSLQGEGRVVNRRGWDSVLHGHRVVS